MNHKALFFVTLLLGFASLVGGLRLASSQNENTIQVNQGETLIVECADCSAIAHIQLFPAVEETPTETATSTLVPPPPTEIPPTNTPQPTNTPTNVPPTSTAEPTETQTADGCVPAGGVANHDNELNYDSQAWFLEERPGFSFWGSQPFIAIQDGGSFESRPIEWCLYPPGTGEFNLEIAVYSANHNSDSFWLVVDDGEPLLIDWLTRFPHYRLAQARRTTTPVVVDAVEGVPINIKVSPRELDTHLFSIEIVPLGGQPIPTSTPILNTPAPPTPEPYPQPTTGGYP